MRSLNQDRLGTNIGKALKRTVFPQDELRAYSANHSITWPLVETKEEVLQYFGSIYNESGTAGLVVRPAPFPTAAQLPRTTQYCSAVHNSRDTGIDGVRCYKLMLLITDQF
jgi:hypothetical protein